MAGTSGPPKSHDLWARGRNSLDMPSLVLCNFLRLEDFGTQTQIGLVFRNRRPQWSLNRSNNSVSGHLPRNRSLLFSKQVEVNMSHKFGRPQLMDYPTNPSNTRETVAPYAAGVGAGLARSFRA